MNVLIGRDIGPALCAALGLPKQTLSFSLHCSAGKPVTVECEYIPEDGGFVPVLAQYQLVNRAATNDVAALGYDTWRRERIERDHREFMERTSRHLPRDRTTEDIARYFGAPIAP